MTDEPSTELCGETNPNGWYARSRCGLAKDHLGDRHVPDPSKPNAGWWRTEPEPAAPADQCESLYWAYGEQMQCERTAGHDSFHSSTGAVWEVSASVPTCSAVLHIGPRTNATYACVLPQGHTEHHKDADGDTWDITWTRPQGERMEAPAVPLTFSRDKRLRALKESQDRRNEELDDIRTRLDALEKWTARPSPEGINAHEFNRIMGRVTATLDTVGTRLIGRGPDRTSEVVAKLNEILTRLGPPDPPRCGSVRPYSGSHGRSGEPNPDDLCVKPEGHTDRHMNGTTTWPHLCGSVWARGHHVSCIRNLGHPGDHRNNDNVWMATQSWTDSEDTVERPFTHDQGCERVSWHAVGECCSHPNGVGPNGCAGCGDYRPSEDEGSPTGTR